MRSNRLQSPEDGIALFYALLVALVVGGVVAVVFATALTEQRQASFELDFEDTIHVAEAGAEIYLGRLAALNSETSDVLGPDALGEEPGAWALAEAVRKEDGDYVHDTVTLAGGEAVAIRPQGEDAAFVYGVGFTPSRNAYVGGFGEPYARVVRVQVAFAPNIFEPDHAMLTGGNLNLSGNYKIEGSSGSVHTNGAISIDGSTGTADAGVSYSGSCNKGCTQANGPVAQQEVKAIAIEDFWDVDNPATVEVINAGAWYDHCSGAWYKRHLGTAEPCGGTLVSGADPNIQPWTGLSYNNPTQPSDAVYYFAGDYDIDIKQPTGDLTFFTGGDVAIGPSSNTNPPNARYRQELADGSVSGWYIVAEGNITVGGNSTTGTFGTGFPSLVWANGTINLAGTMATQGVAFVGVDGGNVGSTYNGGGGGSITYNGDAFGVIPGEKIPLVIQWDEVR